MKDKHDLLLKKAIMSDSCPNIILYGHRDICKLNLLLSILNINNFKLNKHDKIVYKSSDLCTIFDVGNIGKNTGTLFTIIKELINHKKYYNKKNYIFIIFDNFNNKNSIIQNKLRVIIEKYCHTARFIFITDKISSIINPITSRSLLIRIPSLLNKEKRESSRVYIKNLPYDKKSVIFDKIYNINNIEIIKLYSEYNDGLFMNYNNIYQIIFNTLEKLAEKNNITKGDIDKIKEISYNIEKYNIYDIRGELCKLYIDESKYTSKQKFNIIKIISENEYNYKKGYRKLIYNESLLINLLYLSRGEI